jgi:Family of unknown function (DUF6505)
MKLLRTIRLDASDTFVFKAAAEPGEWAVSGAFVFAGASLETLQGKSRAAFRSGFLGIDTLGWSTLVQVVEAAESDRAAAVELLAGRLVEHFGAPDRDAARAAAEEELAFAASLCTEPKGMLIAVSRSSEDGAIRETFRSLQPRGTPKALRAYAFLEVEGEEEGPVEEVDLASLVRGDSK